uniref:Putative NB-ARC, P-loop containing nucleoside triphosphate hydrolase n=1 Tax=Helianthus annuus TaxID=4232 RepID=A0A251SYM2_HELAN
MAEAAAAALVKVIFQKLADEAFKKYARSQNIHSELKQLGITLTQIQALLNDASHKEITDESVRLWLNSLQHLAYDIDDVLDEVATEAMHRELTPESEASTSMVRKLIPTCCTKFSLSHRLSPKLDGITTKLQHLEKQNPGLIVKGEKPKINTNRRNETSLLESDVVGREGEKKRLLNQLLVGESSKENFSILPIVGLGGVGKTTLARILYNDTQVKDHFELMAWQLKDKRFLVVLDDVWNENYDDWENLVRPFHSGATGSRVIMTTRKQQLLKKIGFNHLDLLESLSHDDALSLLARHALDVDNFDSHETLKPLGEGIVEKCGCLPLAVKAIGRLLRTKTDGEEWDDVLNSEIWDLESADEIVPALRLSYHDLSADLKRLFAYCSLFPKDFLFEKEELVILWVAEGYLNESVANKSPECLGHECFEKLLSRSFFQRAPSGEPYFVMHDLMNDLATFVAGEYFLRFDNQMEMMEEALAKYRHMSFIREEYVAFQKFGAFEKARSLRTLLAVYVGVDQRWQDFYLSSKILVDLLPQLPLLRVLSLRRFNISEVHNEEDLPLKEPLELLQEVLITDEELVECASDDKLPSDENKRNFPPIW